MPLSTTLVILGAVVIVVLGITYAFSSGATVITERLGQLWRPPEQGEATAKETQQKFIDTLLAGLAKIFPASAGKSDIDQRLIRAGFRRPEAAAALMASRFVVIALLVSVVWLTGFYENNPFILFVVSIGIGFLLPDFWLGAQVRKRQSLIRLALPDALDLLVICMEAGLGLDQALLYVSQELRIAHPELCDEFDLVNAEVHVGKTRLAALRSLSTRTGVEDLQSLVATLIQTDRFGTSVAQSLRIHSEDLRTKRRQRAEEMAAKTTVKMVFPLVLFIFPALFVVILGPAVIQMLHLLGQLGR